MSQLTAPTHTVVDNIPLWLRIREIMKERGNSHSLTAMSSRLGISRETLRLMLNGEREIYSFELEKIAQDLKIPLRRLLQEDLQSKETVLNLIANEQWDTAIKMVDECQAVAIGLSERAMAKRKVAYICFWKKDYEKSKQLSEEVHAMAIEVQEKYNYSGLMRKSLQNLLNVYAHMNDFEKANEIIETAEHIFRTDPIEMGLVYFTISRMKHSSHDFSESKRYLYRCLEQFLLSSDGDLIGRAYINVAYVEFLERNYLKAKELLECATEAAATDIVKLLAGKDLARTLIKLQEFPAAVAHIRSWLESGLMAQYPDLKARLLILLSRATGNVRYAESVTGNLNLGINSRYLAARYLSLLFKQQRFLQRNRGVSNLKGRLPKRQLPLDIHI